MTTTPDIITAENTEYNTLRDAIQARLTEGTWERKEADAALKASEYAAAQALVDLWG